jgi:hypothetical protein
MAMLNNQMVLPFKIWSLYFNVDDHNPLGICWESPGWPGTHGAHGRSGVSGSRWSYATRNTTKPWRLSRSAVPGLRSWRVKWWRTSWWTMVIYIILYICWIDIIYMSRVIIIYIYKVYIYIYISEWYEHIYMFLWWWMIIDDYVYPTKLNLEDE